MARSDRARQNRAYVRRLLRQRQPEFAAALESVEHEFSYPAGLGKRRTQDHARTSDLSF